MKPGKPHNPSADIRKGKAKFKAPIEKDWNWRPDSAREALAKKDAKIAALTLAVIRLREKQETNKGG